jgi:hypothetical protein
MHVLEVALLSSYLSKKPSRHACGEPMPDHWPRPPRGRAVIAAFAWTAAVGVVVIVLGMAAAAPAPTETAARLEAGQG